MNTDKTGKVSLLSNLTITLIVIFFLAMMTGTASAAKKYRWRAQGFAPPGSLSFKVTQNAFDELAKATDGRLVIKLYGAGALVGPFEAIDAIGKGIFEVGLNAPAYYAGKDPAFSALYSMAGVWPDSTHAKLWMMHFGGIELARKLYDKYNLYYVGPVLTPPECLLSTKPINTLDDLKGLKIRTTPGLASMIFQKLGASPVPMPAGEVYSALDLGVIDAAEYGNISENRDLGLLEVSKYVLDPSFHCPTAIDDISVNKDKYNELPEDLKMALHLMVAKLSYDMDYTAQASDMKVLKEEKEKGKIVHSVLSEADKTKARKAAVENVTIWREKSPMAKEMIDSILSFLKQKGVI